VKDAKHLDVSARLHPDGKTVDLFVINRNLEQPIECAVQFLEGSVEANVEVATLNAPSLLARNTFAEPNKIQLDHRRLQADGGSLNYRFPNHSITRLTIRRRS